MIRYRLWLPDANAVKILDVAASGAKQLAN